jgi:hypothetical protein
MFESKRKIYNFALYEAIVLDNFICIFGMACTHFSEFLAISKNN